jgi:hypothetical protein
MNGLDMLFYMILVSHNPNSIQTPTTNTHPVTPYWAYHEDVDANKVKDVTCSQKKQN